MTKMTALKIGQLVGFALMVCGVASCEFSQLRTVHDAMAVDLWFLAGGVILASCKIGAWIAHPGP